MKTPHFNSAESVAETGYDFNASIRLFFTNMTGQLEGARMPSPAFPAAGILGVTATNPLPPSRRRRRTFFRLKSLAVTGLCAGTCTAMAQQAVVSQPPPVPATPTAMQEYQNSNPMQVFAPSATRPPAPTLQPFQWGPMTLHPHVQYQFLYGNGIQSSPGNQQDSIVQTFSPGMLFRLGAHWSLDYTPTLTFYSNRHFRNTLDHSAQLQWGTVYNSWVFSGSQGYSTSSQPLIETAEQTDQQSYATALNASYQFNNKMSLDMGLNQNFNYVGNGNSASNSLQNLSDSKVWSTMDWLNYLFWARLNIGLGLGYGYINEGLGPDAMYEQYQGRVNWRATDKISFRLSGGLQDQQYLSGGASDLVTPIFAATVQYQPFAQTRLSVTGSRTVSSSYFENQTTENTSIMGDLNQRLLGKLFLDLSGGYNRAKYVSSVSAASGQIGFGAGRSDDTYTFNVRLTCPFLERGTFSVFYQYSDNSSTQNGFLQFYGVNAFSQSAYAYTSSQVGFEIGYRY